MATNGSGIFKMKIIAEVGSNWHTLSDILMSIKTAKEVGADAVKFQLFSNKEMYLDVPDAKIGRSPYLDHTWLATMDKYAREVGIELMCTAFSAPGYTYVDKFVDTHKIASAEITDFNILKKVNSFKKPVYLSTGGAGIIQIRHALEFLKACRVTIMYCVTEYPARVVDFRHVDKLVGIFKRGYDYGYSDHSIDVLIIPRLAKYHGCNVIEKHVNFTDHKDTDDALHSLSTRDFALMVKSIHGDHIFLEETHVACPWQRKAHDVDGETNFFRTK